ncbi:hypothetical protein ACOSP7_002757 [Xanthoceras sorbifolium]
MADVVNPNGKQEQSKNTTSDYINIRVTNQSSNEDVLFGTGRSMPLKMLMDAYCAKRSLDVLFVHFLFEGRYVQPNHTPDELMMEDGAKIEVIEAAFPSRNLPRTPTQRGSNAVAVQEKEKKMPGVTNPEVKQEQDKKPNTHINLTVMSQQDGIKVSYRVRRNIQMKNFINEYCDKRYVDIKLVEFLWNGSRFRTNLTPDELKMKDGDELDVMVHGFGGMMFCLCDAQASY